MSKSKSKRPPIEVLRLLFIVDFDAGTLIWRVRPPELFLTIRDRKIWNAKYAGKIAGSLGNKGYRTVRVFDWPQLEHVVIWALFHDAWPTEEVDHRNRVRSDNRILNLRECRKVDQQRNMSRRSDNSSGINGVDRMKGGRWRARIGTSHIGTFETKGEAEYARRAADALHGYDPTHGEGRSCRA